MASPTINVNIRGLDELGKKLSSEFAGGPARNFLNRGSTLIQNGGREFAPTDRGRLRNAITFQVDEGAFPKRSRIGPNISTGGGGGTDNYAEAQEFGTKPFWPPKAPMEAWGHRKGLTPQRVYLIRRIIAMRGIKPKRYMQQGIEQALPTIEGPVMAIFASELEHAATVGNALMGRGG